MRTLMTFTLTALMAVTAAAFQDQLVQEGLDGRDLIGFVVNGVLRQCHAHVVGQRR